MIEALNRVAVSVVAAPLLVAALIRNRCGAFVYAETATTWHEIRLAWRCLK